MRVALYDSALRQHFTCDESVSEVARYKIFRDYLKHEDDLINNRLSWNFTIQGFLFAAYVFSLQKIADIRLGLLNNSVVTERIKQLKVLHTLYDLQLFLVIVAALGVSVSFLVYLSVSAARLAIQSLEEKWCEAARSWPKALSKLARADRRKLVRESLSAGARTHGPAPQHLPGLTGGGHPVALVLGFVAPNVLPLVLTFVWAFLLVDAWLDLQ